MSLTVTWESDQTFSEHEIIAATERKQIQVDCK